VLLPAAVWAELRALRESRQSAVEDVAVFVSRGANGKRGGGALTSRQVHRNVASAAKRAGLQDGVSPHWLRHAHSSHALNRGAPIHVVRETLARGSLAVTGRSTHAHPLCLLGGLFTHLTELLRESRNSRLGILPPVSSLTHCVSSSRVSLVVNE
jgi:site-specific recombinase XerC